MKKELEGKIAIVTGGASGIGRATVQLFVEEGARVVIADIQDERGEALADELGDAVRFQRTDVSDAKSVQRLVDYTVEAFGGLDIMYNNAGVTGGDSSPHFLENDLASFERVMAVDLLGPILGSQCAGRYMAANGGGSIINTASIAGSYGGYGIPDYRAAKAGVVAFTKSLAIEFGNYNIRVNAISPGAIQTEILSLEGMVPPDKMEEVLAASMETMLDFQVLKRIGLPRDIAEAALFLASNRSAQITGLDLIVDAGASLGDKVNRQAKMHADMAAILGSN